MRNVAARAWAYRWTLLGGVLGALAGAMYAHFVGCRTGGCVLTSSPLVTGLLGGAAGASFFPPARGPAA